MIDAVLTYHTNPFTCGVAKFNHALAKKLGVPCRAYHDGACCLHPLVSIKPSEMPWAADCCWEAYDLLLHDRTLTHEASVIENADRVFYADEIGCPSTIDGNPVRGSVNVLLFGMAHKIHVHTVYVERLRDLLQRAHADYTVSVSTSVHEAQPWDETFTKTITNLRHVFGDHLRVLGYLADDALARELQECSACALFFDPAARANNTTIWGALEAGCPVVTNLDHDSPAELRHNETIFDLARLTEWPLAYLRTAVAAKGQEAAKGRSWEKLIAVLRGE